MLEYLEVPETRNLALDWLASGDCQEAVPRVRSLMGDEAVAPRAALALGLMKRTPPTPQRTPRPSDPPAAQGGRGSDPQPSPDRPGGRSDSPGIFHPDAVTLAQAAIAALRPDHRTRIDELGRRRLERAARPLVDGWTPTDLATRIGAERVDRAENLAAVLAAILRRYALEPPPEEIRAAHQDAERARRAQPPPEPCAHGDPGGCTACSFCRRALADPDGEQCTRCAPSVGSTIPMPKVVQQ